MGFRAQWRISEAFLSHDRGMFLSCSVIRWLWISMCIDRIGESPAKPLATQRSSRSSSAIRASRLDSVGPSSCSTLRKSASATTTARPLPTAQRATKPPLSISHEPLSVPGETVRICRLASSRCFGPVSACAWRVRPQCFSSPVSAKDGGGRSLSPSGRLLGQSSHGSASRSNRPPSRTHRSRSTSASAGCARGCARSRNRPWFNDVESVVPIGTTR